MWRTINQERGRGIVCEGSVAILNKVVRKERVTEKTALEQDPEEKEQAMQISGGALGKRDRKPKGQRLTLEGHSEIT